MKKILYTFLLVSPILFITSCEEDIEGCTDPLAVNFASEATLNDNSCIFDSDGDGINDDDEVLGCTDISSCNYNIDATDDGECEYPEYGFDCDGLVLLNIGDEFQGGVLFYIDETGKHGLVVGKEDLGAYNWGCLNVTIPGADIIDIGGGLQNTLDILAGCSDRPIAASIAFEYEYEDFADWYLPSRSELQEIYLSVGQGSEIGNIGGFIDSWYWSSTEDEIPEAAYCFSFIYGAVGGNHREGMINVRPIRSF
tara:strand:- start:77 stop:835 length:759 start_codon:yes stop_codon:yes gene_type:complete